MKSNEHSQYCNTLGVAETASFREVRRAYRHLVRKYHPDATGNDKYSVARFKAVQSAYNQLRKSFPVDQVKTLEKDPSGNSVKKQQEFFWDKFDIMKLFQQKNAESSEFLYEKYASELEDSSGMNLMAFVSLKGGTGKSFLANNISVIISLVSQYLGRMNNKPVRNIELIDMDFGKPDQRILLGKSPKYYIEDLFSGKAVQWNQVRTRFPIPNFCLVSTSPARQSSDLYWKYKNRLIYNVNESDAHVKIIDFGGTATPDQLFFLRNINRKILITNPEDSAREAAFKLIVSFTVNHINRAFGDDYKIKKLTEKLLICESTNYTVSDLVKELGKLDTDRITQQAIIRFYEKELVPVLKVFNNLSADLKEKTYTGLMNVINIIETCIESEMERIAENPSMKIKLMSYKRWYSLLSKIKKRADKFNPHVERLFALLENHRIGIIVNKAPAESAQKTFNFLATKIKYFIGYPALYLGNVPDYHQLRNVSNLNSPYIINQPTSKPAVDLYRIVDSLLNLKKGVTANIIGSQKEYIEKLCSIWKN